jgi:3-oxoacyl-[acyl-carrier protein] reductase
MRHDLGALVTGGTSGIGFAIAERLAANGARVVLTSRSADAAARAGDAIAERTGREVVGVGADVRHRDALEHAVELACVDGRLDIAVANAGVERASAFLDTTPADWDDVLATNLTGVFHTVQLAAARMLVGGGRIVVVSSTNAFFVESNLTAYNASKSGLLGLVRSAAIELARYGITVNSVAPGLIHTPMTATLVAHPAESKHYLERVPLRRFGEPGDIAGAVAFLSGPDAAWITGHELVVDGGQTIGIDVPLDSFGSGQGNS